MPFRAVQVVSKALEIAEQQLLTKSDESQLADDSFLDFQHVHAFLEFTAACLALSLLKLHDRDGDYAVEEIWTDLAGGFQAALVC